MELTVVDEGGVRAVEGQPDQRFISSLRDLDRLIEACFSDRVESAILYAANLPDAFFDLSSGMAGAVLQKLSNYRIRLAVVWTAEDRQLSSRFGELVGEAQRGGYFGLFDTRRAAREWLGGA